MIPSSREADEMSVTDWLQGSVGIPVETSDLPVLSTPKLPGPPDRQLPSNGNPEEGGGAEEFQAASSPSWIVQFHKDRLWILFGVYFGILAGVLWGWAWGDRYEAWALLDAADTTASIRPLLISQPFLQKVVDKSGLRWSVSTLGKRIQIREGVGHTLEVSIKNMPNALSAVSAANLLANEVVIALHEPVVRSIAEPLPAPTSSDEGVQKALKQARLDLAGLRKQHSGNDPLVVEKIDQIRTLERKIASPPSLAFKATFPQPRPAPTVGGQNGGIRIVSLATLDRVRVQGRWVRGATMGIVGAFLALFVGMGWVAIRYRMELGKIPTSAQSDSNDNIF